MNKSELTALAITVAVALVMVLLLVLNSLTFDPSTLRQPPRPMAEVVEIDEEFVEFFEVPVPKGTSSQAYTPQPAERQSQAAEATGSDIKDAGNEGVSLPDVVSEKPSPVERPKKETPEKKGPTKEELEAEAARRRARKGISDAFKTSPDATDNTTSNSKNAEKGDSGKPDGGASAVNGSGTGNVGGGWIMPSYAKVKTDLTGRIELRAVINSEGKVVKVEQTGGKAPAGADPALVAKCIAEIKRHTFTRSDNNAPPTATARITYTFR